MSLEDVFSERKQREYDRLQREAAEREAKAAEERARRERAPLGVGNGRVFQGLVR